MDAMASPEKQTQPDLTELEERHAQLRRELDELDRTRWFPSSPTLVVSLEPDDLAWAERAAARTGMSVAEAVAERRRLEAMREVDEWLGEDRPPLTDQDLEDVRREWRG
jgi:hypothetical protein